jgi:hypothetical protein
VKLDAAGVGSGDEDRLDALVAKASQEAVEEGLVDRAYDLGGAAGQAVERAVAQPQGVVARTLGLVAVLFEQLAGGGEGPLGPQSPECSGAADVGAELPPLGGGDPSGGGQWRFVGGCLGDGVDQQLSDQFVVALGDGDPQLQVGGLIDLGPASHPRLIRRRLGAGPEQPGGDQLVEVEGGQAT